MYIVPDTLRVGQFQVIHKKNNFRFVALTILIDLVSGIPIGNPTETVSNSLTNCLVSIGRLQIASTPTTNDLSDSNNLSEFVSRHSADGKFTFVDPRASNLLGYRSSEMLGKFCFDYYHPEDLDHMRDNFEQSIIINIHIKFRIIYL